MKRLREGKKKKVSAPGQLLDWIRKKVTDLAYLNSEHIVRDLTCRRFSISRQIVSKIEKEESLSEDKVLVFAYDQ